jgi:hypothetical protein
VALRNTHGDKSFVISLAECSDSALELPFAEEAERAHSIRDYVDLDSLCCSVHDDLDNKCVVAADISASC